MRGVCVCIDPQLVINMPKKLTAWGGVDALVHALESYVSVFSTDYTRGLSLQAIKIIFQYLPRAYHNGSNDFHVGSPAQFLSFHLSMRCGACYLGVVFHGCDLWPLGPAPCLIWACAPCLHLVWICTLQTDLFS